MLYIIFLCRIINWNRRCSKLVRDIVGETGTEELPRRLFTLDWIGLTHVVADGVTSHALQVQVDKERPRAGRGCGARYQSAAR